MAADQLHIHLVSLKQGKTTQDVMRSFIEGPMIRGKPHGWIHQPQSLNRDQFLQRDWNLFLVTREPKLPNAALEHIEFHLRTPFFISKDRFEQLRSTLTCQPKASDKTPPLPQEWQGGGIPASAITTAKNGPLECGELRLDPSMADFLSNALPSELANKPVSLFNLFKYKGSSAVHDDYMEDFKKGFGNSAGATVRFMGPVDGALIFSDGSRAECCWDDVNLVQYDTIWHYAYMLSTDLYAPMNKKKASGLDDTCILCVSEIELWQ